MPGKAHYITEDDLLFHLSGGALNFNPASSLGGTASNYQAVAWNSVSSQLFDDVTYEQRSTSKNYYRGVFLINPFYDENDSFFNVKIWIKNTLSTGETVSICTDSAGITPERSTMSIAISEILAPSGTTSWYTYSQTMSIGTLPTASGIGIWIRRYVPAGTTPTKSSMVDIMVQTDLITGSIVV